MRFNPKRHTNHRDYQGSPLCGARNAWAIPRSPVTCVRCQDLEREYLALAMAVAEIVGAIRRIGRSIRR